MSSKPPAFQFYPQDYLASSRVAEMTLEEEGVYIRLLCYCWSTGSIPADPERCARLAGKGCTVATATVVQRSFNEHPTDPQRLVHDRLEIERENQRTRREQASSAGKKSAERRSKTQGETADTKEMPAKTHDSNGRSTDVQRNLNPSSSSSSSSSDIETQESALVVEKPKRRSQAFVKPSVQEIIDYILEIQSAVDAKQFWDHYESNGWRVGSNPMKDWRATVRKWQSRSHQGNGNGHNQTRLTAAQHRENANASAFDRIRAAAALARSSESG